MICTLPVQELEHIRQYDDKLSSYIECSLKSIHINVEQDRFCDKLNELRCCYPAISTSSISRRIWTTSHFNMRKQYRSRVCRHLQQSGLLIIEMSV